VLTTGSGGAEAFMSSTLTDPTIARLRDRVRVTAYAPLPEPPNDRPSRVSIRYRDGRRIVGECLSAQGGSDRPFPAQVFIDKIAALTSSVYPHFVSTFQQLMHLDASDLARPWPAVVERICVPG
jgi:hypothetical protein